MKTVPLALAGVLFTAPSASPAAPGTEFRSLYGSWDFKVSGTAVEGGQQYDFRRDLDAQHAGRRSLEFAWDTGAGWWPDVAFGDASIGVRGSHTTTSVVVLPPPLPPTTQSQTLSVDADFRDQDFVARYPLRSGALKVSAGVAVKHLKGTVVIDDSSQSQPSRGDYNETFPELQLQARWTPMPWLAVTATGQGVQYQGNSALEWRAALELAGGPLLLEAGWQEKRYEIGVNADALDVKLSGALLRAGFALR